MNRCLRFSKSSALKSLSVIERTRSIVSWSNYKSSCADEMRRKTNAIISSSMACFSNNAWAVFNADYAELAEFR